MKFGVVTFPGSNCDEDMAHAVKLLTGKPVERLWHKEHDLRGCDMVLLPGGFSYGDYLRSGAIARFSPIMQEVAAHAAKGGLVFGVCNGFQVLCEAGLLPGALLHNEDRKFVCRNTWIRPATRNTPLTAGLKDKPLRIPVAHGEGRFHADKETLKALNDEDRVLFHYCDEEGRLKEEANPNGSVENIAGVCNAGRNVFGMMPHPERAVDPLLGNTDGATLFASLLQATLA
ncbi:MAG: phosphoribosylformylglycinamidine synthase subunit PurQ [Flavobacteriales bacterium]|nr:phosphoribosylformylglycinamidine synthase subunit PurQ [Flavobacteriales bacterium]MCL4281869.1 phosphoribosylformylglycinamidine synthase subunit PurQ [Flavobacteriales bacterium]